MTRIGRQLPHFSEVDVENIRAVFSADKRCRYVLQIPFRQSLLRMGADKQLCVILKNPSSADESMSDATIRKVETYVYHRFPEVSMLTILNLFALRATDAADVQRCYKSFGLPYITGDENDVWFRSVLGQSEIVICAWGGNSGIDARAYTGRIARVRQLIVDAECRQVYRVAGGQATGEPLHGLMWGYRYECVPFEVKG